MASLVKRFSVETCEWALDQVRGERADANRVGRKEYSKPNALRDVWNGSGPHINNVELGRFGRNRSNVWGYAGVNGFGQDRDAELAMNPTVKPLPLVADAILDCSKRGGVVLDAFAGSGTTLQVSARPE